MDGELNMTMTWDATKTPLVLVEKKMETSDAASFFLKAQDGSRFDFKPGQFVTLKVQIDGWAHARAYSISSLPGQNMLQLTIKRVPGGLVSNWMLDLFQPGDVLWTYGIAGEFNIIDSPPKAKVLLIGAGCGVTPVMSMARFLTRLGQQAPDILFLHAAKDVHNVIFLKETMDMAEKNERFDYHLLLEQKSASVIAGKESYGLMGLGHLMTICPDYQERAIYLCGPKGLMDVVNEILQSAGFDMKYLYQENFAARDEASASCDSGVNVSYQSMPQVSVPDFNFAKTVAAGSVLLNVLEEAKMPVVAGCRTGLCGACKCKVTKGWVESSSLATLSPEEVAQGYVLACSSKVVSDIEVELKS